MSATPRALRRSRSRLLAALTAAALMFSGVVFGAVPAQAVSAEAAPAPAIDVSITDASADGATIRVQGSGFDGISGAYGAVIEAGTESSVGMEGGYVVFGYWMPPAVTFADGAFDQTLVAPADALERDKDYEVIVWVGHSNPDASTIYTRQTVPLTAEDWDLIDPLPLPTETSTTLSVAPEGESEQGEEITLTASVSPADAPGSVTFSGVTAEGSGAISESVEVVGGSATTVVTDVPADLTGLRADFAPADASAFAPSASDVVPHTVVAPEEPETPTFDPALSVFLADGTTPYDGSAVHTGDELVVVGTGFDPAANVGGRGVPIPNTLPQGAYVVLGSFLDDWQPSAGAKSSARTVVDQRWALSSDVLDQVDPKYQGAIRGQWVELGADGSFTATLTAQKFEDGLEGGNWGVYTYGAGGVTNAAQELSVPIDYVGEEQTAPEPDPAPAVTVTPNADLDPNAETVLTISGTGFVGASAANGAYVLFGEESVWHGEGPLPAEGWIAQGWVMPNQIVEGAFTTTLTVPAGVLDPEVAYHVATSAAHGLSVTDRSLDTFTPITVAQPAGPVEPGIRLSADAVAQGGSVTVSGSGLPAGTQVSVELHSDAVLLGSGLVGADGTFSVQGTIPASTPPGAHTIVVTGGGLNLSTPITITAAPVPAPAPAPEPAPEVCVANAVSGASLSWGVKESFVNYINGPIAKGSVSGSWGSGSGAYSTETGNGSVSFGGSMHFTGHSGALDLTLSNPRVRVNGSSATLYLSVQSKGYNGSPDINASGVAFATISLPSASTGGGEIGWSGASAALTAAGADAFAGFYGAGEALDAVSIAFPLGAEVPCDDSTGGLAVTGGEPAAGAAALGLGVLALGVVLVLMRRRRVAV